MGFFHEIHTRKIVRILDIKAWHLNSRNQRIHRTWWRSHEEDRGDASHESVRKSISSGTHFNSLRETTSTIIQLRTWPTSSRLPFWWSINNIYLLLKIIMIKGSSKELLVTWILSSGQHWQYILKHKCEPRSRQQPQTECWPWAIHGRIVSESLWLSRVSVPQQRGEPPWEVVVPISSFVEHYYSNSGLWCAAQSLQSIAASSHPQWSNTSPQSMSLRTICVDYEIIQDGVLIETLPRQILTSRWWVIRWTWRQNMEEEYHAKCRASNTRRPLICFLWVCCWLHSNLSSCTSRGLHLALIEATKIQFIKTTRSVCPFVDVDWLNSRLCNPSRKFWIQAYN